MSGLVFEIEIICKQRCHKCFPLEEKITTILNCMALKEKIPVIIAAQLNREASDGEPKLHHLRESGSVEQDADIVIFPWINGNDYTLSVAKNRRGLKGGIVIFHNDEMTRFYDTIVHRIISKQFNEPDNPF